MKIISTPIIQQLCVILALSVSAINMWSADPFNMQGVNRAWTDKESQAHTEYYDLVGKAEKAAADADWVSAESSLIAALKLEPGNPSNVLLLSNLGMVRYYAGREAEALATLDDAHFMAPRSVTVLLNRARVLTSVGRATDAYNDYNSALEIDSTLTEARFFRAMLSLMRADTTATRTDLEYLAAHAPSSREANVGWASYYRFTGDFAKAIPYYSRVLEKESDVQLLADRALCYLMTGNPGDASEDIGRAMTLDPHDGELYLYRALLNKMRYRPDDARADADRAKELGVDPQRVDALMR